jgi:DNA-binding MarR family transcriptional regulator
MSTARLQAYVPLIQKFAARVVLFHSAVAGKLGLHTTDLKSLRLLGEESMSASALGEQIGLTGAAVTALIDRLEKAGYVVRERGADDRRRITVHAVPKKLREVDTLYTGQHARMSKLLSKYSADEFRVIADFLEQATRVLTEETKNLQDKPQTAAAETERTRAKDLS